MDGLSPIERKRLKARAHALSPIVHIGGKGLTEAVIAEIGRALDAHELIKVRAGSMERDAREAAFTEICARLGAQPVQHIGKVFVLYRQKPESSSLLLIEDARRGFEDIAAGRVQGADTAVARIQRRRAAKANLIGSVDGLPEDLSAEKKRYLRSTGYGRKRPR